MATRITVIMLTLLLALIYALYFKGYTGVEIPLISSSVSMNISIIIIILSLIICVIFLLIQLFFLEEVIESKLFKVVLNLGSLGASFLSLYSLKIFEGDTWPIVASGTLSVVIVFVFEYLGDKRLYKQPK